MYAYVTFYILKKIVQKIHDIDKYQECIKGQWSPCEFFSSLAKNFWISQVTLEMVFDEVNKHYDKLKFSFWKMHSLKYYYENLTRGHISVDNG